MEKTRRHPRFRGNGGGDDQSVIAEDEPAVGILIEHFIAGKNLPVEITERAANGKSAVQMIGAQRP